MIELLKKAAKTKRINVVIELRARFDEQNNCMSGGDYAVDVAFLLDLIAQLDLSVLSAALDKLNTAS